MPDTTILRPADVCRMLSISAPTLFRWKKSGILPPAMRLGPNVVGWEKHVIDSWLAERKAASQQVAA